jgi:hypothetical protein
MALSDGFLFTQLRRLCVAFTLVLLATSSHAAPTNATSRPSEGIADPNINVLMIVLDEAPLFPLLKTDGTINSDRYPGFASLAANSTWYRNMVGTAQRTTEALPSILDGRLPTFKNYPYLKDHPDNLFTAMRGKKKLDVFQAITHLCPKKACENAQPTNGVRLFKQIRQFNKTIQQAATATEPTLSFAHVLLPHRPWILAPDMRYSMDVINYPDTRSERLIDRRRDNYQSLLRQYLATDSLVAKLVRTMKSSSNWDNTMIIVTADHGITFQPGKSYRDTIDPKSPGTLEDIYRIPLFIKYPKQVDPTVNDCAVSSIDILPTILSVSNVSSQKIKKGFDLSTTCPQRESRTIGWPAGSYELRTSFDSLMERVKYYNRWINADSDVDGIYRSGLSGSLLGATTPGASPTNKKISWFINPAQSYQGASGARLTPIPARTSGEIFVQKSICKKCEGLIAVNDVFVGVISELSGMKSSTAGQYFTSSVMTRAILSKQNKIELWIADWSSETPVLTRVGSPTKK